MISKIFTGHYVQPFPYMLRHCPDLVEKCPMTDRYFDHCYCVGLGLKFAISQRGNFMIRDRCSNALNRNAIFAMLMCIDNYICMYNKAFSILISFLSTLLFNLLMCKLFLI